MIHELDAHGDRITKCGNWPDAMLVGDMKTLFSTSELDAFFDGDGCLAVDSRIARGFESTGQTVVDCQKCLVAA